MEAPIAAYELTFSGRTYTELIGRRAAFPSVPSGPPAYVFDAQGKLLTFTFDDGDDPGYLKRWRQGRRTRMSPTDAQRLLGITLNAPGGPSVP